jgi:hypothetical protein
MCRAGGRQPGPPVGRAPCPRDWLGRQQGRRGYVPATPAPAAPPAAVGRGVWHGQATAAQARRPAGRAVPRRRHSRQARPDARRDRRRARNAGRLRRRSSRFLRQRHRGVREGRRDLGAVALLSARSRRRHHESCQRWSRSPRPVSQASEGGSASTGQDDLGELTLGAFARRQADSNDPPQLHRRAPRPGDRRRARTSHRPASCPTRPRITRRTPMQGKPAQIRAFGALRSGPACRTGCQGPA